MIILALTKEQLAALESAVKFRMQLHTHKTCIYQTDAEIQEEKHLREITHKIETERWLNESEGSAF